jgi:hypothetical protein
MVPGTKVAPFPEYMWGVVFHCLRIVSSLSCAYLLYTAMPTAYLPYTAIYCFILLYTASLLCLPATADLQGWLCLVLFIPLCAHLYLLLLAYVWGGLLRFCDS